nr:RNA-directed DNA polymerase, eukaryota, reverse transcriptase zinc-binding domain protein [Tanacetum cinerariifolium]
KPIPSDMSPGKPRECRWGKTLMCRIIDTFHKRLTTLKAKTLSYGGRLILVLDPVRWNKCVPQKINIHAWKLLLDRLPTRHNLDVRGIDLDSTRCPMCDDNIETTHHLFLEWLLTFGRWFRRGGILVTLPMISEA